MFKTILCLISLIFLVISQQCRNNNGWRVDWWVVIMFPNSTSTGFAYFDSRFAAPTLKLFTQQPDSLGMPLTRTLQQLSTYNMQSIAWNDDIFNQSDSTTSAHSKSVGAYDPLSKQGFFIIHSIPQYPKFSNNNSSLINITIDQSQQIYGQHLLCISANKTFMLQMISKIIPIKPQIFIRNYDCMNIMSQIINNKEHKVPDYENLFNYMQYERNGSQWSFIFKNGEKNGSIFQDGVNNMLNSSLLAQTWGRPLQQPWCGGDFMTGNILQIAINSTISWKTTQDHSKWLVSKDKNISCFGDMNRMESQWKRGGAFYCLNSSLLNQALKSIIKTTGQCATM